MKRHLITLLKIIISLGIVAYLVFDAKSNKAFADLRDQPKEWGYFPLAIGFCSTAVLLTMIRWHFLVRALAVPTKLAATLRISFVGYLFNLAPLGIAGGDLVKILMLAGEHKNSNAKAVASVVLDRVIGLYMLFVVASVAILCSGFHHTDNAMIREICRTTWIITVVGGVAAAILMIPAVTEGRWANSLGKLPGVGKAMSSLLEAVRMYRRQPGVLFLAAVMTIGVHSCFAIGVCMIAWGLHGPDHSLATHLVIMPLSAATGVVPLSFGPFEMVLEYFYFNIPLAVGTMAENQGLIVALGYRLITVLIASVGAIYYFASRREVSRVMSEVTELRKEIPIEDGPNIALSQEQSAA